MTEEDYKYKNTNPNDEKDQNLTSAEQPMTKLLAEFGHLFLLFLRKLLLILWALLKLGLKQLLKYTCKAIILLWDLCQQLYEKCKNFWYDNDTQAKIKLAKRWAKEALRTLAQWTVIALIQIGKGLAWTGKQLLKGLVWLIKETIIAIIHLGPTLKKMGQFIVKTSILLWKMLCKMARTIKIIIKRQQQAYQQFRKNKGFKGLLIDLGTWMKNSLNDYLDETAEDDNNTNEDNDDDEESESKYMKEENTHFDKESMGKSKVHTFGRSLYNAMKKIVDED